MELRARYKVYVHEIELEFGVLVFEEGGNRRTRRKPSEQGWSYGKTFVPVNILVLNFLRAMVFDLYSPLCCINFSVLHLISKLSGLQLVKSSSYERGIKRKSEFPTDGRTSIWPSEHRSDVLQHDWAYNWGTVTPELGHFTSFGSYRNGFLFLSYTCTV